MPGPNELWAWLQSIMQNQGAGQPYGPGAPTGGAGPQAIMPGGGVMGYPAATPGGPSMGYPAVGHGDGPSDVMSPAAMYAAQQAVPAPPGPQAAPNFVRPEGPITRTFPMWPTPPAPSPARPPFNWLTSTGAGMSAPPSGPLAAPSGQGGIGSDYAASARNMPLKRKAGAPNLGYYTGGNSPTSMGGARNPVWTPYANANDPRIYRG